MHPSLRALALTSLILGGCRTELHNEADARALDAHALDAHAVDARTDDASTMADASRPSDAGMQPDAGSLAPSLIEGAHEVLFVGNSYIFVNDVPAQYRALAAPSEVRSESTVTGGYRLAQHAVDARTDGTPLGRWLRTGTAEETNFDVVILQEQSQIGGFPEGNAERMSSLAGASMLAALARAKDIDVVLYLTWGRERGDEMNPVLFADFTAMQDRLDAGYRTMAAQLRAEGSRVRIAPVGAAFRVVHARASIDGADPTTEGSAFDALYDADGSHPSAQGAYLAASVILATITGQDPRTLTDPAALDPAMTLRDAASTALQDATWAAELR